MKVPITPYSGSNLYCCMITFAGVTQQNYSDLKETVFLLFYVGMQKFLAVYLGTLFRPFSHILANFDDILHGTFYRQLSIDYA